MVPLARAVVKDLLKNPILQKNQLKQMTKIIVEINRQTQQTILQDKIAQIVIKHLRIIHDLLIIKLDKLARLIMEHPLIILVLQIINLNQPAEVDF